MPPLAANEKIGIGRHKLTLQDLSKLVIGSGCGTLDHRPNAGLQVGSKRSARQLSAFLSRADGPLTKAILRERLFAVSPQILSSLADDFTALLRNAVVNDCART